MNQDAIDTHWPCPQCERCPDCKGSRRVTRVFPVPFDTECETCRGCSLCRGTHMVPPTVHKAWRAKYAPPPGAE